MVSSRHQVPRLEVWPTSGALVIAVLALWVTSAVSSTGLPFMEYQTTDLVLGGVLVVTGVHARNFPFLHAGSVLAAMPWPLDAGRLWQRALRRQRRLLCGSLGGALSVFACAAALLPDSRARLLWAAIQVLGLGAAAAAAEPLIAGLSSSWGRRFPEAHPAHSAQRQLSGGWTRAEAVVHLYAGAGALALTLLIAMLTQLLAVHAAHGTLRPLVGVTDLRAVLIACLWVSSPLAVVPLTTFAGRRLYVSSTREATPWLHEAITTLSGPPTPTPAPLWVPWIPSATLRLWALQRARTTPLLTARLLCPTLWAAWAIGSHEAGTAPTPQAWAVGLIVAGAWCSPVWQTFQQHLMRASDSLRALPSRIVHASAAARGMLLILALLPATLPLLLVSLVRPGLP